MDVKINMAVKIWQRVERGTNSDRFVQLQVRVKDSLKHVLLGKDFVAASSCDFRTIIGVHVRYDSV